MLFNTWWPTYFLEKKAMVQNSYTFSETLSFYKGNEQSFFSQSVEELKEKKRWRDKFGKKTSSDTRKKNHSINTSKQVTEELIYDPNIYGVRQPGRKAKQAYNLSFFQSSAMIAIENTSFLDYILSVGYWQWKDGSDENIR